SGFLAAFAAGLTIAAIDVELCDCFIEYGGVTAEMLLLFTFVIFGSSLIWTGFTQLDWSTILFAAFAMVIRVPVYLVSLLGSGVDRHGRSIIVWFGPKGLSSLLLILLPVFAGLPGSDRLFAVCAFVVLLSVVIHGASPMLLTRFYKPRPEEQTPELPAPEAAVTEPLPVVATQSHASRPVGEAGAQIVTLTELERLQKSGEQVIILDVRTERSIETSESMVQGAVRMPPDHVVERARELKLPKEAWLVAYCA
ncbi:MAG TPA: cation:proton antiporter, partial [Pyrinomonadaceae bacterium]|nr:cation:proton antiporter [Pyrinomonadaceae bacterium]